jgi:hypothetical protein
MSNLPDIVVARKIESSEYHPICLRLNFSRALISTKFADFWMDIIDDLNPPPLVADPERFGRSGMLS